MDWTQHASNISADDEPELAKAWRLALIDLLDENFVLVSTLPNLLEDDLKIFQSGGYMGPETWAKLHELGLAQATEARPFSIFPWLFRVLGYGGLALIFALIFFDSDLLKNIQAGEADFSAIPNWYLIIAGIIGLFTAGMLTNARGKTHKISEPSLKGKLILSKLNANSSPEHLEYYVRRSDYLQFIEQAEKE